METENVSAENFLVIQGWMIKDLELKGNDLLVYAIIYGFSQSKGSWFSENLQYIADWTCSTKNGVLKNIKNLVEQGLIEKDGRDSQHPRYRVTDIRSRINETKENETIVTTALTDEKASKEMEQHETDRSNRADDIREIIDYLNLVVGRDFKSTTQKTRSCIIARLNEGFTVDDFKTVIDKKNAAWGRDSRMSIYLRPETLFGNKFEGYLQEPTQRFTGNNIDRKETGYQKIQRMIQEGVFDE